MRKLWTPDGYVEKSAVGLDLDGVARDTGYKAYLSVNELIKKFGGKPVTYADYILKPFNNLQYVTSCGASIDKETLHREYHDLHPADNLTGPFADVTSFCEQVGMLGLDLFVVTACRADWVVNWFKEHSLGAHFAQVIHSAKPKDPHLRAVCAELGVEPDEVFYVGDMGHDMEAAIKAEILPVGITRGYDGAEASLKKAGAKMVVRSLEHLACLIS